MHGSSPAGVIKWRNKNHYKKLWSKNQIGNKKEGELITRRESNGFCLYQNRMVAGAIKGHKNAKLHTGAPACRNIAQLVEQSTHELACCRRFESCYSDFSIKRELDHKGFV